MRGVGGSPLVYTLGADIGVVAMSPLLVWSPLKSLEVCGMFVACLFVELGLEVASTGCRVCGFLPCGTGALSCGLLQLDHRLFPPVYCLLFGNRGADFHVNVT